MVKWWETVNPFTYLGNAVGSVAADNWAAAMVGLWNAGLWLLKLVLTIEDAFLVPDLSAGGPMRAIYPTTFWVAGTLVGLLLMVQLGIAAVQRDGQSLARVVIGTGQFVIVWGCWVAYCVAVVAAAGGLTRALMQSLLHVDAMAAWQPWTGFSTADITDGTIATVLGVLGLFLVFSAFAHLLVMLARGASLLVLAATNPISAAGLVWEGGRSWFWKAFRWFHAAAFTPVVMMLMLGLGVQVTSQVALSDTLAQTSLQKAVGTAVPGVMLILVGCFAPLALFKLLAFVDPGTSSGAAMRAGMTAQDGLKGLLRGTSGRKGGGDESEDASTAASASDTGGRSEGEAATEAATSERFAKSAGSGLGAVGDVGKVAGLAVGATAGAATAAAAIGGDLTSQMGVGHSTPAPDFAKKKPGSPPPSSPPQTDGQPAVTPPDCDPPDHPDEGLPDPAGPDGGGWETSLGTSTPPPDPTPVSPAPSTPSTPSTPSARAAPGGSGGSAGASSEPAGGAGGAAGAGEAGAVPVVPV